MWTKRWRAQAAARPEVCAGHAEDLCVCVMCVFLISVESALTRYRTVALSVSLPSLSHLHTLLCSDVFLLPLCSAHFHSYLWMEPQDAVSNNWALCSRNIMQGLAPCLSMQLSRTTSGLNYSRDTLVQSGVYGAFVGMNFHVWGVSCLNVWKWLCAARSAHQHHLNQSISISRLWMFGNV